MSDRIKATVPAEFEVAGEVALFGESEQRRAEAQAQAWATWAEQVDQLAATMPIDGVTPRCMDEIAEARGVYFGAHHIDPEGLRDHLEQAVTGADALAWAWRRAATRCAAATTAQVAELREWGQRHSDSPAAAGAGEGGGAQTVTPSMPSQNEGA